MSDLPKGWEWAELSEVLLSLRNGIFVSRPAAKPPGTRIFRISAVRPDSLDPDDVRYAGPGAALDDRFFVRTGDLLFTRYSGNSSYVGSCAVVPSLTEPTLHPDKLIRAVVDPGVVNPWFLAYAVNQGLSRRAIEARLKTTAGQIGISGSQLRTVPVPLAPRAEQERIVAAIEEHLSRLDAAKGLVAAARERVALLARSSMRSAFGSLDCAWTTLGEVADIKGGVTKDSKRQADPTFVEAPYLRVANVQRGYLDLGEITTIRVHPTKAKTLRLEPGDVLFNEGGDRDKLGRGWVWEGKIDGCIHQNHVFRARVDSELFDPYFVSIHGNTWGQAWFEEHGRQTTNLASIDLGTLKRFPVPAPPLTEQRAIVSEVRRSQDAHARLRVSLDSGRTRAAALRRSILAAAFSGQLVPQDPEDEPASILLGRIGAERAKATPTTRPRRAKAS